MLLPHTAELSHWSTTTKSAAAAAQVVLSCNWVSGARLGSPSVHAWQKPLQAHQPAEPCQKCPQGLHTTALAHFPLLWPGPALTERTEMSLQHPQQSWPAPADSRHSNINMAPGLADCKTCRKARRREDCSVELRLHGHTAACLSAPGLDLNRTAMQ